jgi:hypothetical protein
MKKFATVLGIVIFCLTASRGFAQTQDTKQLQKGQLIEVPFLNQGKTNEAKKGLINQKTILKTVVFEEDFESGLGNWNATGSWDVGEPEIGPEGGYNSLNAAGTNLTGDYPDNADESLSTQSITLPSISESESITLQFMEWFEIESGYDYGYVEVTTDDGANWSTLSTRDGSSEWRETELDLTPYAGEDILLSFRFSSDYNINYTGWFIDDVKIIDSTIQPLSAEITSLRSQGFPQIVTNVRIDTLGAGFPDLTQENFTVYENGVLQTDLFNVTPPEEGGGVRRADIVFLMDNSGSMDDEQDAVEANVFDFVNGLEDSNVDYSLGLTRYGGENRGNPIIEDNGSLTSDAEYFKTDVWMRNRTSGGDEPGYYGITEAANSFNFRPGSQRIFIIITDESPDQGGASMNDALNELDEGDISLFALTETSLFSEFQPLTEATGGQIFDIYSSFSEILNFISTQVAGTYVLRYRSSNPEFDGTTRTVRIEAEYNGNTASSEATYVPGAAPSIQRTDETVTLSNEAQPDQIAIPIEARITDDIEPGVQQARLFYKPTQNPVSSYTSAEMNNTTGNIYRAEIPASAVDEPGMDYYISATDGNTTSTSPSTNPAADPFQIAILPNYKPDITHTQVTDATVDQPIDIAFTATDNTRELESVKLFYRRVGQLNYEVEIFDSFINQSDFLLTIPAEFVTTDGVEYYIEAEDDWGLDRTMPENAADEPYTIKVGSRFFLKIVDANGAPIPNKEFTIYKVTDHNFSEDGPPDTPTGTLTTDEQGHIELDASVFSANDKIKIERKVHTEYSDDNPVYAELDNVHYQIFIDNAQFDSVGDMSYPTVTSSLYDIREIPLDHTTIIQNLAVSVEWDASDDYLNDILEGMKKTSNYMYDVADGQFYIGKVAVFDNKKYWDKVDIQRYANNQLRPTAPTYNFNYKDYFDYILYRLPIRMPRIWKIDFDLTRNHVYSEGDLSSPFDFKTVGHELGHYLFSFKDEYKNDSGALVWNQLSGPTDTWNFGFMDSPQTQYKGNIRGGEYASEMSSLERYPNSQYKVTRQWQKHRTSCWGTFTNLFEGTYDDIFCPIKTPNQIDTGNRDYLVGPNNDLDDLTIDVGSSIEDSLYEDANTGAFAKKILLFGYNGSEDLKILSAASVTLVGLAGTTIDQGKTTDNGGIVILGAHEGDVARYYKKDNGSIYSGEIPITNEHNKRNKSLSSSSIQSSKSTVNSASQDSLIIEAKPLDGNFQNVATVNFNELNTINFSAVFKVPLPETPDFELYNNLGSPKNPSVSVSQASQYSVSITEPIGETGFFSFIAEDNSSNSFFVDHDYILYDSLSVNNRLELSGPSGSGELLLDSLNTSIENVLMLTSNFPPILNGLPESAELAGEIQTIASYPSNQQFSGANALTIQYADSDINEGRESSITIFKWISENKVWKMMDGMVDTVRNSVVSQIPSPGTYAAFTTELETPSDGGEGQQGLMLDQNYPNPFSRLTTIIYSIPKEQHVTLTVYNVLGRKVATLVDEELEAATHYASFDAHKLGLASGTYIYRLVTEEKEETKKMMFIR